MRPHNVDDRPSAHEWAFVRCDQLISQVKGKSGKFKTIDSVLWACWCGAFRRTGTAKLEEAKT
jgi:hypothetical protein